MGTSPVTDRVEIEKGDVLQIDFFNIFPLFYLLYLLSIQKKEGAREVAALRRAIEASTSTLDSPLLDNPNPNIYMRYRTSVFIPISHLCVAAGLSLLLASPCCWPLAGAVSVPFPPDRNMSSDTPILLYKLF